MLNMCFVFYCIIFVFSFIYLYFTLNRLEKTRNVSSYNCSDVFIPKMFLKIIFSELGIQILSSIVLKNMMTQSHLVTL